MHQTTFPTLLTVNEAADAFRVSKSTIQRWAVAGKLPYIQVNGGYRFREVDVLKLLVPRLAPPSPITKVEPR